MYRPYGDDPNQELYAGEVSTKPLTEKERAAIQLKLRTQAAMAKPPAGLAQLANNALSDPSIQAIMYLLGLPETVMTSLATAVRNPGALPAGDLAKATWDRLQKGYTYADLYKSSGMNPQAADIAGLAASITSPVGDKATAVRAAQGAMKAGADALAAAGNAGIIGKNAVAQTLMNAGYPAGAAARAEKGIAASLGAGAREVTGNDRPVYWDVAGPNVLGGWHAIGRLDRKGQPLSPKDFQADYKVVQHGIAWMRQSAKEGTPIYIYRSAPNSRPDTGHGAQQTDGTFFTVDPTVAASYALNSQTSSGNFPTVGVVEAVLDPKKIFVVQPKVVRFDDADFIKKIREKEKLNKDLELAQHNIKFYSESIASIDKDIARISKRIAEAKANGQDAYGFTLDAIEAQLANSQALRANYVDELSVANYAASDYQKLIAGLGNVPSAKELSSGKYVGSGKYSALYTPDWKDVAPTAWAQGYDAIFNPATGEVVVSNVSRGKKGSPIDQVMGKAVVRTDIYKLIGDYAPTMSSKMTEEYDPTKFYPLSPTNASEQFFDLQKMFDDSQPWRQSFLLGKKLDPSQIQFDPSHPFLTPDSVGKYYRGLGYSQQQIADEIAKLKPQIEQQIKSGGIKYSDWFFIATGMPYSEYLKTQTKIK